MYKELLVHNFNLQIKTVLKKDALSPQTNEHLTHKFHLIFAIIKKLQPETELNIQIR